MFFTKRVNTERVIDYLAGVLIRPVVMSGGGCFGFYIHNNEHIGTGSSNASQDEGFFSLANTQNTGTGNSYLLYGPIDVTMLNKLKCLLKYEQAGDSGRFAYGLVPADLKDIDSVLPGQTVKNIVPGVIECGDPKTASYGPYVTGIDVSGLSGVYYLYIEIINTTVTGPDVNRVKIYSIHFEV